jgi:hypothetical protein
MLSLDGLRHPLLLRLPIARQDEKSDFDLSKGDLMDLRVPLIQSKAPSVRTFCIFANGFTLSEVIDNLASRLSKQEQNPLDTTARLQNEMDRAHILSMVSSMRDRYLVRPRIDVIETQC